MPQRSRCASSITARKEGSEIPDMTSLPTSGAKNHANQEIGMEKMPNQNNT
jgi:hypothetical protein